MANANAITNGRVCCGKTMVEDHENFELVGQRVEELATLTKTREEVGWTAKPVSFTHLRKILKKQGIFDAVNTISDGRAKKKFSRAFFLPSKKSTQQRVAGRKKGSMVGGGT